MYSWDRIPARRAMWRGCRLDLENRLYYLYETKKKKRKGKKKKKEKEKKKENKNPNRQNQFQYRGGIWALSHLAYVTAIPLANTPSAQLVKKVLVKSFETAKAAFILVRMLLSEPWTSFYWKGLACPKGATFVQRKRETSSLMRASWQARAKGTLLGYKGCSWILLSLTQEHEPVPSRILIPG